MASCSLERASLGAVCGALALALALAAGDAAAQSDAGQPPFATNEGALADRAPGGAPFQKTIAPSSLPESVQRRLRERAGADPSAKPLEPPSAEAPRALSETARRIGDARMRRVQAFDTGRGVTILSNRLAELPSPTHVAAREPEPISAREGKTLLQPTELTETRSLRAAAAPVPRDADLHGWLWPLAALLAVSAALAALVYRRAASGRGSPDKTRS